MRDFLFPKRKMAVRRRHSGPCRHLRPAFLHPYKEFQLNLAAVAAPPTDKGTSRELQGNCKTGTLKSAAGVSVAASEKVSWALLGSLPTATEQITWSLGNATVSQL